MNYVADMLIVLVNLNNEQFLRYCFTVIHYLKIWLNSIDNGFMQLRRDNHLISNIFLNFNSGISINASQDFNLN